MSTSGPNRPLDEPLVFAPFFRPQVWGGRRLQEQFGKPLPDGVAVGESWELSAQPLHVSQVQAGPWQGVSLSELWEHRRAELLGESAAAPEQFPWLIKWLDCHELLSVQVHPDDAAARKILGEPCGKTESWVVVHAEPTAQIYAGLRPGVTRAELERRSKDGTVAECLHGFTPRAGDCVHIPAGTVHAVGGGVVMAEVQQTSDATFRLFDWNRVDAHGKSRTLHLEQAMAAIDFERGPVDPVCPLSLADSAAGVQRETLVNCPYYMLERFTLSKSAAIHADGLTAWMLLNGLARLSTIDGRSQQSLRGGDVVLVPAKVGTIRWEPVGPGAAVMLQAKLP